MANTTEELTQKRATDVLRDSDRDSVGVVRILADAAGTPGEEREYQTGDEALVEAGRAEWVVAPVFLPSAGRRLDTVTDREAVPADGAEAYPPAEPTTSARRSQARREGAVDAHSDEGLSERLAKARAEVAREAASQGGDARRQAELGGFAARSGPVTAQSDLPADQPTPADEQAAKDAAKASRSTSAKASDKG